MKKLLALALAIAGLAFSSSSFAQCNAAGFVGTVEDCANQQQLQGQAQGQAQGQGQGQAQSTDVGNGIGNFSPNAAAGAAAYQGQLQGNVGLGSGNSTSITQTYNADTNGKNNVFAFAPSISSRSTTNCITTYSASGGNGGNTSVFSLGLSIPIRDEDCVAEQAVRTGFETSIPEAQQLALELYKHQMGVLMEKQGHLKVATVLDNNGQTQKVMYSDDLRAFVPIEKHPTYQKAAAVAYVDAMLKAGYTPRVSATNKSGFQTVSFPLNDSVQNVSFDEVSIDGELIEAVIPDVVRADADKAKFVPVQVGDRN